MVKSPKSKNSPKNLKENDKMDTSGKNVAAARARTAIVNRESAGVGDARVIGSSSADEGMVSGLLHDMKELLLKGEIPASAPPISTTAAHPKKGPGSTHRTPTLVGWGKNPGGSFGVELPEGGLAGGGLVGEPLRMAWARRLANTSDIAAQQGHMLVRLCDNVSKDIDVFTEKCEFFLDVDAANDCIKKVVAVCVCVCVRESVCATG